MRFSRNITWLALAGFVAGGLVAVGSADAQTASPKAVEAQANGKKAEKNAAGDIAVQSVSNRADRGAGVVNEGDIYDSVLNEDGSRTIRLGVAPKAFSDGKTGMRTKISTDLIPSGDGFAAELAEPVRIGGSTDSTDLVSVGKPGKQLRLGKPNSSGVDQDKSNTAVATRGVKAGEGKATPSRSSKAKRSNKANEVGFDQAFGAGTTLTYEILNDAVKESIVLTAPPAGPDAPIFRFPITADGLKPQTTKEGSIEFVDAAAKVVFTIPQAFAFDSRSGANTPGNAYVNVKMELVSDAAGYTIVVAPSIEWLRDKDRVYPVTIDPTVQLQPWNPMNLGYMPWGNNSGGNSFSAWTNEMIFGNWWGSQWRSYIQFDPTLFAGKTITNATLNMRVQSCDNQTNPAAPYANSIGVHKLTSAYYFGQSWPGASWNGEVWASPAGPNSNSTANITAFAAEWAANSQSNLGLMLDMGSAQGYCRVQRTAPTGQQTFIEVTYNEAPSTVQEYGYLKNFSFENGQSSFQACSRAEAATWSVVAGSTPSGLKYAKLRANNAGDVSICQAIITPVGPTKQYNLIASVRSSTGVPISGKVSLLENGPSPANAKADFTTVGTAWQNVSVSMNGVNALNWGLQTDVFVGSPFTADLDIDYVVLSVSNVPGTPPPPVYPPSTTPPPPPATAPPTTVPPAPPGVPYRLNRDQYLLDGGYLISPNGRYRATVTSGNLVVMDMQAPTSVKWSSSSSGNWGSGLLMQGDGNLVMYSNAGQQSETPIWNTYTNGTGAGNYLVMQDDSNLVVYRADGVAVWSWWGGRVQLPNPPAPTGPVIPVVVVITGGTTVIPTTPTAPVGAHLLTNGVPTILELSDTVNLDCLVLSGTTAVLTTDKTQCLLVTPFLVPYGYLLGIGDLEDINDAESCLVPSGSSFVSGTCVANQDSIVTDLPGTNGLLFPLRRFSSNYDGACVTRSGTSLTFAYCPTSPASNQLWYDKKAAPRTDPCEAWGNMASNSAGEPLRMDAKTYEYNTSINSGNAAGVSQGKARGAVTLTGLPGPLHRPIASKMLSNYIYSGGDVVLSQKDMGKVISAGKGSNVRDIPQRIRLDGLQSSSYASEGQVFASAPPSVTQYGSRTGKSRTGQPEWNGSDENLNFFAGWNRYVSADSVNGNPDYPSSAGDVWFGLGSFDLRTEGKVLSGYRCFNIYLYDRYMFANTGLSVGPIPPIVLYDEEMANLNRLGMAKSFNIRGVWRGCFLPPGPLSTMSCPGHPSLR